MGDTTRRETGVVLFVVLAWSRSFRAAVFAECMDRLATVNPYPDRKRLRHRKDWKIKGPVCIVPKIRQAWVEKGVASPGDVVIAGPAVTGLSVFFDKGFEESR